MKFNYLVYIYAFFMLLSIMVLGRDTVIGIVYIIAVSAIMLLIWLAEKQKKLDYPVIAFIGLLLLVVYYLRPILLLYEPYYFKFAVGVPDSIDILNTMVDVSIESIILLVILYLFSPSRLENRKPGFIIKYNSVIWAPLLSFSFILVIFHMIGIGVKGANVGWLSFLIRFVPIELLAAISIYIVIERNYRLNKLTVNSAYIYLITSMIVGLLNGSKSFIISLIIPLFVLVIIRKRSIKIRFNRAIILGLSLILILSFSFLIPSFIRFSLINNSSGGDVINNASVIGDQFFKRLTDTNGDMVNNLSITLVDRITSRTNGFDGSIVTSITKSNEMEKIFSLSETLKRIGTRLLPASNKEDISSGVAVGLYYRDYNFDSEFAGALGIFGAIKLMLGKYYLLGVALFSLLLVFMLKIINSIKDYDVRTLVKLITLTGFIFPGVMSGNFDSVISRYLISLLLSFGLIFAIKIYPLKNKLRIQYSGNLILKK